MTPRMGLIRSCQLGDDWTASHHLPAGTPTGEAHTEGNAMTITDPAAPTATDDRDEAARRYIGQVIDTDLAYHLADMAIGADAARAALAEAQGRAESLAGQVRLVEQSLQAERFRREEFQRQVRDVAIRVAEERDWCDQGLNEVLDELGLDRKETEFEVTVTIRAHVQKTITVTATDEADARARVQSDDEDVVSDAVESGDFDWDDDDVDIDEVTRP